MNGFVPFIILCGVLGLGFVWAQWIEPNSFCLRRKTVQIKKRLSKPLMILHISDPHFTGRRPLLERFFDRLSRLDVDFVFVTGDLIDGPGGIEPCVASLRKLKPKRGTYAVLGNHDYKIYPFLDQIRRLVTNEHIGKERPETGALKEALVRAGIHLLANENRKVALATNQVAILVGVDDPVTGRADLEKAFRGIENGVLRLALIHSPAPFPSLGRRGVDVAFAGHTHGGQIRIPGKGPLPMAYRLEPIIDSTDQYGFVGLVSRGLGASPVLRLRLFCRPEAVLVRLEGS